MNILTPHQSKALAIDKSISLTANAGSGKTFVLAQRFLEIILNTSTPLNKIAAITFTEKAAGELYKRISDEINKLVNTSLKPETKQRVEKVRKQLVSTKISTIHSFCIDLLKEFPVEASVDANFTPINETNTAELIDLSVESTLKELMKNADEGSDVKLLTRLLGSVEKLKAELAELIKKRKNVLNLIDKYYSRNEEEVIKLQADLFNSKIKLLFENSIAEILNYLNQVNRKVIENKPENQLAIETEAALHSIDINDDIINLLQKFKEIGAKVLTKEGKIRDRGYLASSLRDEIQDSINAVEKFFNDLNEIDLLSSRKELEAELAKHSLALIRVFQDVLIEFENKKSESGVLDFEDILLKTKSLMKNELVRKSLSEKFDYLLVDEYQDTNEIQYEIFLPLVDDLKRGNLFIVGDEKQSIYRFRDAELQVFSKTKTDIRQIYGSDSLLTLPDSFRMAPSICFFVNSIFKNLFREPKEIFNEVAASDLVCARSDDFKGQVEFLIADGSEETESELVVKRIIQLKKEQKERIKNWSDIAVLVRKRAAFSDLQKAFIKYGIPFNIVGGTGFYQKQSINDIYNYFAFLLNEKNDSALIGILRSPFFLISDVKVMELSLFDGDSYWDKLKNAAVSQKDIWGNIFEKLEEYKNIAHRINVPALLRKILSESNFITIISSRIDGLQEISNLNKLISETIEFFSNEFNTFYDYVTFLDNAISKTVEESQGRIEAGSMGVNILTIHQSKGLEFPAVFLYKCSETTLVNQVRSRSFSVDKEFGLLTKVPTNENYFGEYLSAPIVGLYNLIESKKDLAEIKRLLYVALTRAKDFLFISQIAFEKIPKNNSFSALLTEGLNQEVIGDKLSLNGELTFLKKQNDNYISVTEIVELEIPIIHRIELEEKSFETERVNSGSKKITLQRFGDQSKGEIISATRFSTYSACPLKYNLLYNYKLGDLVDRSHHYKNFTQILNEQDFNLNELSTYLLDDESHPLEFSKRKGQLIHYILRKDIYKEDLENFLSKILKEYFNREVPEMFRGEILNELSSFYDSDAFKFINSFQQSKSEFEVYLKKQDYYLFGIIDRLLISEKKLVIVDFKTDFLVKEEITSKAETYLPQLNFYAYIISRLFKKKYDIEGRVIFIKFPDNPFTFNYSETMDKNVGKILNDMINSIRSGYYAVNLDACNSCIFSDKSSKCITNSK